MNKRCANIEKLQANGAANTACLSHSLSHPLSFTLCVCELCKCVLTIARHVNTPMANRTRRDGASLLNANAAQIENKCKRITTTKTITRKRRRTGVKQ